MTVGLFELARTAEDRDDWRRFLQRMMAYPGAGEWVECRGELHLAACTAKYADQRWLVFDWCSVPPGSPKSEVCRRLRRQFAGTGLVATTRTAVVEDRLQALEAGVDDCVAYDVDPRELMARMQMMARRFGTASMNWRPERFRIRARALREVFGLSPREEEILLLMAQGVHLKEVGASVGCNYSTVRTHARRLCRKLECSGLRETIIKFFAFEASSLHDPEPDHGPWLYQRSFTPENGLEPGTELPEIPLASAAGCVSR